jgi:hypothetical protein
MDRYKYGATLIAVLIGLTPTILLIVGIVLMDAIR